MDREAWRAVIHGVTKSRIRLSIWTELNWFYINNNQKSSVASKGDLSSFRCCRMAGVFLLNSAMLAHKFLWMIWELAHLDWALPECFAQATGLVDSGISTCYSGVQAEGEAPWWKLVLCQLHEYKRISRNIDLLRSWIAASISPLYILWAITRNMAKGKFQGAGLSSAPKVGATVTWPRHR